MLFMRIIFHLLPIVGLVVNRPYTTLALVLIVLLPYIKVRKLAQVLEDLGFNLDDPVNETHDAYTKKTYSIYVFWKKLTFIK